jgi:hypothetical protein
MARAFMLILAPTHREEVSRSLSSASQGRKCIRIIWDTFLALWRQRNEFIYGQTQESKKIALTQVIEMKVNQCFERRQFLPFNDQRRLFQKSKADLLAEDLPHIQTWVRMAERIIRTNKRELQRPGKQQKRFEQYFKWNPPDQRRRQHEIEQSQHRKNDLKPD